MRYGPTYYDAKALQTALLQMIQDEKTSARDIAPCTRTWMELERLKREMRGIPPLAAARVNELVAKLKQARPTLLAQAVEIAAE